MMAQYNEKPFEDEFCAHLASLDLKTWQPVGTADTVWLYSADDRGYDRERALFPDDLFGWLADTQSDELAKIIKPAASEVEQRKAREAVLDRIAKLLDTPLEAGGGTLNLLRSGFKHTPAKFDLSQPKPDTSKNPATAERYAKVRVRIMRQVHYSTSQPKRSLDLVAFVNGLPVATFELKTDFTQTIQDAITQYKTVRLPRDPNTKKIEPLFGFGRALVHFAVSNDEVWMTTHLAGADTTFLPFNRGRDGGAGNPLNPHGSASSYLWEQVLERDSWLRIIHKFLVVENRIDRDPDTGAESKKTSLVFPRYHQWEAVNKLITTARDEGPGNRYLIQHSAGSGKTNSIAWTTHQLANLHDTSDEPVFDGVIVVTDRTVLDSQLQDAITQIDHRSGVVETISRDKAGEGGHTSKSGQLAQALLAGRRIIVCTLQTFPFAMDEISRNGQLATKKFAVIADEAHSSQTGATASKLKAVLSAEQAKDVEDGAEIDSEALLAAEMTARADNRNISYFAFTATPKARTLELFGRNDETGTPQPFHVYTMQQAIEEGFILDVLLNYTTYKTAFQLAHNAEGIERTVDESEATKSLMRWVKLHPTNISQKVAIIVEHYRANVEHLLDGRAKAMVVTDSRKAAVRYKTAIDKYIDTKGYPIKTLVAFSGDVVDPETGPDPFNEGNMNPDLRRRDLRTAFATREFRIMLVANKFQTGFDQPLLAAMYVDRQLSGVTAVQTLSRLNRRYPGKDKTYILDFVNDPDEILNAFLPYYRQATLTTATDPNLVHDLQAKLDAAGIYTRDEVEQLVDSWIKGKGNNALAAVIGPAKQRFRDRYDSAVAADSKTELDELDLFRRDLGTFIRLYDFTSQVIDYGDTDLEKRSIYYRLLERQIRPGEITQPLDLSGLELQNVKQIGKGDVKLDLQSGESVGLTGITAAGSAARRDPKLVKMQEILARLNDLFADEDFSQTQKESWLEGLLGALLADSRLVEQARINSKPQFLESPDLRDGVTAALLGNHSAHAKMVDMYSADDRLQLELIKGLGELLHVHASTAA
jgi:type I restriction enzyme R subunit